MMSKKFSLLVFFEKLLHLLEDLDFDQKFPTKIIDKIN